MPKLSYWSNSSMNWVFAVPRNAFKYRGFSLTCRTRLGQYCGKYISVVSIGRGVSTEGGGGGGGGETLERGGGAGLRSITGGGWFRYSANWLLAALRSSCNFLRRFLSSLYR